MMRTLVLTLALVATVATSTSQSWRLMNPVLSHTLIVNPKDPKKLYIGNWANQIYRSDDFGTSWRLVEVGDVSVPNFISTVGVSRADTSVIIVAGYGFDGIKRSSNSGATFTRALNDTNNAKMWFVSEAIIEDPYRPGTWYAARGATNDGIWRSTNNGATWDSISAIPMEITPRLCTITARRDSANILFVGAKGGHIFRSDDAGLTWRQVPVLRGKKSIRPDSEIPKIVFSPRDPMTGYAIVCITLETNIEDNGGILKTTDGGATWDRIALSDTSFWAIDVREKNGQDELFVGGFRIFNTATVIKGDGLVFHSTDGGTTWGSVVDIPWSKNELDDSLRNVWVIRCDSASGRVYMATTPGLYVLEPETGVHDVIEQAPSLSVTILPNGIAVHDAIPSGRRERASVYDMQGRMRVSTELTSTESMMIPMQLEDGAYLLVMEGAGTMRTAPFTICR